MSFEHPYPDHAYLEVDPETNEKRWFSTKGMGVQYVHEDRMAEEIEAAVKAEREACAKIADDHHTRINRSGHSEHGSQCLDQKCNEAIAVAIRNQE